MNQNDFYGCINIFLLSIIQKFWIKMYYFSEVSQKTVFYYKAFGSKIKIINQNFVWFTVFGNAKFLNRTSSIVLGSLLRPFTFEPFSGRITCSNNFKFRHDFFSQGRPRICFQVNILESYVSKTIKSFYWTPFCSRLTELTIVSLKF